VRVAEDNFADRLLGAVEAKRSHVVVGLDPAYEMLPPEVRAAHPREAYDGEDQMKLACYRDFLLSLLDGLRPQAVAVKPQIAYFEALGSEGYALYMDIVGMAKERGYLVIADVKRGDIGSTAEAYAQAHLDVAGADAVTVNPYFGTDGLEPFFARTRAGGKGVFVLVKTSNPSSREIQDLLLSTGEPLYERVADLVSAWGRDSVGVGGYQAVGAVVGGTHPGQGSALRERLPRVPFLVPGYGAQGAQADDLRGLFDERGTGAMVNSARAILYAYRKRPGVHWLDAARQEAEKMRAALWRAAGRG
jgi:orotidine-5'-phosphate decarboxylase